MRPFLVLLVAVGIAGCAHAPAAGDASVLFEDALFPPPPAGVVDQDIFAVSPAMRDYLATTIAERVRAKGPRLGLMEALREDIRIDYDASVTRDAAQTFAARAGNCLSLVVMTAALARAMGIPVVYQDVRGYDAWTRSGGIAFYSGHVNMVLGSRKASAWWRRDDRDLVVDFLPANAVLQLQTRAIPESMVAAMYRNNRAAEAVAAGDTVGAYAWARAAIEAHPPFLAPYNTLGVVYLRRGAPGAAERAFRYVLAREPENEQALANLAQALRRQGRLAEMQAVQQQLAALRANPPYRFLDEGLAAMARGDPAGALQLFEKELARMPYDDEVHLALAAAYQRLGDVRRARRHLRLALERGPTRDRRAIYAAKLEALERQ
jgi:tetratricopeptide (TPR) repeat protein